MTGRELTLALVGAALVGGAAGAAASLTAAPKTEAAAPEVPTEVLHRLKSAEDELAKTRAALEESRTAVNQLSERVAAAEIKAAKQGLVPAAPANANLGGRRFRTSHAAGPDDKSAATDDFVPANLEGLDGQFEDVRAQIGDALVAGLGEGQFAVPDAFAGLQSGLELRRLPETDRWQKAKDDLGLSWNQVEDLKKAVADRDAAMKEAMTTEKKTGPNGGNLTIQRTDPAKAAHAEADYHDRVNAALNDDQKKKDWRAKGYDHAFGSAPLGGMGGSMVMSIDLSSDRPADTKDARK